MSSIAVTGPRKLSPDQARQATAGLGQLLTASTGLLVGDATGLDALALGLSSGPVELHHKNPALPWRAQGAERSARLIKAALAAGATLQAWPNKPAPVGLKPSRTWPKGAEGSGTTTHTPTPFLPSAECAAASGAGKEPAASGQRSTKSPPLEWPERKPQENLKAQPSQSKGQKAVKIKFGNLKNAG